MRRRRNGGVLAVLLAALVLAGCGTASDPSPPSGIDQLVIPTPSPDPSDFVPLIDNPWLPLEAGSTWTYRTSGTPTGTLTVTVEAKAEKVAGIVATVVTRTDSAGTQVRDYYAQDRRGNVWWFGREGEWRAGDDGAQAGLAMPATPRLGDGWRTGYQPGVVEERAYVARLDQTLTTPAGRYDGLLGLDTSSPLTPGVATRSFYARGIGLVEEVSTEGPARLVELESGPVS